MQILDNFRYVLWWCGSICHEIFILFKLTWAILWEYFCYFLICLSSPFQIFARVGPKFVWLIFFEDGQTLLTMNWTIFSSKHMVHKKKIHRFQKWKHPIVPALSRVVAITFFHLHWNSPTVVLITFRHLVGQKITRLDSSVSKGLALSKWFLHFRIL